MEADFVIVGAGSGGSAVAWRLAEAMEGDPQAVAGLDRGIR